MPTRYRHLPCAAAILMTLVLSGVSASEDAKKDSKKKELTFERDILPIFKARCASCHSGPKPKGELSLDRRSALIRGGKSGSAIRIGAAEFSRLWARIAADEMPAKGAPLTADEKGRIRAWINDGARSNAGAEEALAVAEELEEVDHWAFAPPVRPAVPILKVSERARTPIDAFIMQSLLDEKLALAPEADRATLLRRAHFDLIGLPPTPAEVQAFLADDRPAAYERMVERLLASPHYGERWARHWLDVAGYADSAGILSEDRPLPFAWRYRDYVVEALNKDKPYDRFLQEQIAGDELTDYWTAYETLDRLPPEVIEGITATGYLRMAADSSRPDFTTIKNAASQYFYPTINDTMQIVASSTMGLTLQCARCHNHKYDPIPQVDFYRLQAVFMSAYRPTQWVPQMNRRLLYATAAQKRARDERNAEVDKAIAAHKKQLADAQRSYADKLFEKRLSGLPPAIQEDVRAAIGLAEKKRDGVQRYLASKFAATLRPDGKTIEKTLDAEFPAYPASRKKIKDEMAAQERRRIYLDEVRALYDLPGDVETPLLLRGDALTPGPKVQPGVLRALKTTEQFQWKRPAKDAKTSGRRLAFAKWLTQPSHPLTARVMVNRVWLHHFGTGIVGTPEDFGIAGEPPSHLELLDWLAVEFVESGWSVKHVHRLIMNSAVYRQRSRVDESARRAGEAADPDNRLLWRQNMRRLEAEPLRDAILSVSGRLDHRLRGRPIRMQRHSSGEVTTLDGVVDNRRSIYLQVLRLNPLTMLELFDQPKMETNCVRRGSSTVAMQALTLLNSKSMNDTARKLADRILREAPERPVEHSFLVAYARPPSDQERQLLNRFLTEQTKRRARSLAEENGKSKDKQPLKADEARRRAMADLCHMLIGSNEFLYID